MKVARIIACCFAGLSAQISAANPAIEALARASCAADTVKYEPAPLAVKMTAVPLGPTAESEAALPPSVKFIAGWHLTSKNAAFGGLSGLDISPSGELIAISDKGYFISFGAELDGNATLMRMLDAKGKALTGKVKTDAEGLAFKDGLAFVSFERNHRILAYNLDRCGVAAKGVPFANSIDANLDIKIGSNSGAESLDITNEGKIRAGFETTTNGKAPLISFNSRGEAAKSPTFVDVKPDFSLVGADEGYVLFRTYDSKIGNRIIVRGPDINFQLTPPRYVDNFEGIAVKTLDGGVKRLYLISDDNFSGGQRTLLYIFEISP